MVAVGAGPTREDAVDAAFARLAQSIEVRVRSDERADSFGETSQDAQGVSASAGSALARSVRLTTDRRLPGVRVMDAWRDADTGTSYARVGLDRAGAAARLEDESRRARADAERSLARIDSARSLFARLATARKARARAREALDAALTRDAIVGSSGSAARDAGLAALVGQAASAWAQARARVRVAVIAETAESAPLAHEVEAGLLGADVPIAQRDATVEIRCRFGEEPAVAFRPDLQLTRWSAETVAIDRATRVTIDRWSARGVVSGGGGVAHESITRGVQKFLARLLGSV